MYTDALTCFQQIQFYNRTGTLLCDLQQPQNYTKVIWKTDIPFDQYRNYDTYSGGVLGSSGSGRFLKPSNGLISSVTAGSVAIRPVGGNASLNYLENSYLEVGTTTNSPSIDISLPLSMIKNSIFDIDKDLYFNEIMILRLVWGAAAKVGFTSASASDPTSSPVSYIACDVQNVYLFLATERNQEIVDELKEEVMSNGLSIPIPFVYSFKTVNSASTNQSSTLRITRGHGTRLLKIYHSMFTQNETLNTAYQNTQSATTLQNFYTQLDNYRLQDFNVNLALYDDWAVIQRKLEKSITFNSNIYRYNWFWLDDFTGCDESASETDPTVDNRIEGIDLTAEKRYDFIGYFAGNVAYNHYDFVVTQKMMGISANGLSCQ